MSKSSLVVYGARCVWWDSIDKVALAGPNKLPVCPHCGSVLFETEEKKWWADVRLHDKNYPGYVEFVKWWRGRCAPNMAALRAAYEARTKFSPGPWSVERPAPPHDIWSVTFAAADAPEVDGVADETGFADVFGQSAGTNEANANLIAAAPDLYAALEMFTKDQDGKFTAAYAAMKKARGES